MLGAPSFLIERSHLAALDEIRHARRCYALASAYAGGPHGPGAFCDLQRGPGPQRARSAALAHLASASLIDGALGEGVASAVAASAATTVIDPVIRQTWEMIAVDETRHAELAWDVIAWCLQEDAPAVAAHLQSAIAALPSRKTPQLPPLPGISDERFEELGFVSQPRLEVIVGQVIATTMARATRLHFVTNAPPDAAVNEANEQRGASRSRRSPRAVLQRGTNGTPRSATS